MTVRVPSGGLTVMPEGIGCIVASTVVVALAVTVIGVPGLL